MIRRIAVLLALALAVVACSQTESPIPSGFDLVIANGEIYDGLGGDPYVADVAIAGDRVVAIGENLGPANETIDATGLAVAPGFINMLSWATDSLIEDGLSQSDIRQATSGRV
jgi:N-acyl-D-amino-acid deacylase